MSGFLEDVDAKIRLLTYLRNDLAEAFIGTDLLRKQLPLDNAASPDNLKAVASSQSEGSPPRFVKQALGSLDRLPPELLQEVLYNSDLRSLTNLRALNPETRSLIDSLPHYRTIIERVPDALRLMLSTGTASYFTLTQLYDTLLSQECFVCGSFGGCLSVLNCRRCCFYCVIFSDELLPLNLNTARVPRLLGSSRLPIAFSIPGSYGYGPRPCKKRKPLILRSFAETYLHEIEAVIQKPLAVSSFAELSTHENY